MLAPLSIACAFLTRLPVRTGEIRPDQFGPAAACFPLIGLGLGACSVGIYALCAARLGAELSACLILAFGALVTGGLHLDGLADWFDAVGGGRGKRERMLEIMHDPRIGAHGASALFLVLAGKLFALASLPGDVRVLGLIGAPACARAGATWLLFALPSARSEGLGQSFAAQIRLRHAWFATAFACAALVAFGLPALGPLLLCAAAVAVLGAWANVRLGGITGDVCGAAIELGELAFLLGCRAL